MKIGFLSHLDLNLWLFRLPIMQELVRRGHMVYAICPTGNYSVRFSQHGIIHIPYDITRASLNVFRELTAIYEIYKTIKPLKLDILHTFTVKPNIYGTIAGRLAHIPRIINLVEGLGSFYLEDDPKSRLVRTIIETLYRLTFKLSDTVMFVNSDDPRYLISRKIIDPAKVVTINGVGIDTSEWSPLPKKTNIKQSKIQKGKTLTVLMIARAVKHKGVLEYIAAANRLRPLYPNVTFLFAGEPDCGNPFSLTESFMKEQKNIIYLGHQERIRDLLAQSDIFVLPSYREGLPRTILEAMSMGLPIVTTNTVGCRETVDDKKNGFLVPIRDGLALAKAIEKLILDPALRHKMGRVSRHRAVNEFDIKKVIAKHLEVYGIQ